MEKLKALTLEAGKYYRTRTGHKAIVLAENPFGDGPEGNEAFIGVIQFPPEFYHADGAPEGATSWGASGGFFTDHQKSNYDLIAEWVEPKRIKGWMNVYSKPKAPSGTIPHSSVVNPAYFGSHYYSTKELADEYAVQDRIACIEIDFLGGTGLEGAGQ